MNQNHNDQDPKNTGAIPPAGPGAPAPGVTPEPGPGPAPGVDPATGQRTQDSAYARHAQVAADRARAAAQDALTASRRLFTNPAAGIGEAHVSIGQQRILGVAIVFALVAAIGLALAGSLLLRAVMGAIMGGFGMSSSFHFVPFLKNIVIYLLTIGGAGVGVWLLAPLFGGRSSPQSGLFVGATAFLPLGLAALAAAIVGAILSNRLGMILIGLLMIYGLCYLVMVLNAGLRQIANVDERRAALATPTVLAVAAVVSSLAGWLLN